MISSEMQYILDILEQAGNIVLQYYNKDYDVHFKKSDIFDPVTNADIESDIFLRKKIKENYPFDEILSEEHDSKEINYNKKVWMIDPIDGTKDFIHGGERFSIMIGCCENGIPILGAVYLPIQKIRYFGEKNKGAYKKTGDKVHKISVSKRNEKENPIYYSKSAFSESRPIETEIIHALGIQSCAVGGSIGIICGEIAEATGDAYFLTNARAGKWDICGPQCILEEAGGIITDADGRKINYTTPGFALNNYILASNNKFHKIFVEICKPVYDRNRK